MFCAVLYNYDNGAMLCAVDIICMSVLCLVLLRTLYDFVENVIVVRTRKK